MKITRSHKDETRNVPYSDQRMSILLISKLQGLISCQQSEPYIFFVIVSEGRDFLKSVGSPNSSKFTNVSKRLQGESRSTTDQLQEIVYVISVFLP